ncbi:MAG: hypothetical protein HC873_18705, partial [Leptolyngbyaceae cyanobacterium SL_1_1]|nr:hypothetical protein [Leptolyngbyaceae cyanobacterium SL_1_1]
LGPGQSLTFLGNSVTHTGAIAASGGTIRLLGDRVSLLDQASLDVSSPNGGGTVLVGGDYQGRATVPVAQVTTVGPDTTIRADALSSGNGGEIIVWAAETANIHGILTARGGAIAGNGGLIETSGRQTLNLTATVEAGAPGGVGNVGGLWLIDPENVFITASGGGPIGSSDVDVAEINNALNSGTSVTITTDSVGTGLIFQASDAAILKTAGGAATLTLATDGSIFLEAGIITSGALTVVLQGNSIDVLNSISSANIQMQANFINIGSSLSSSGGNVSLQGGDISIGTGDPGLVSASALTVNANRLSIFNDSFLFGIDSLSITADVIQSVDATPGSSAFTSDNINADIIAGGTFSLTANEIRNFLTEQPGDFSTLRGNISNDISPFIGSSESPSGSEAPSSIARSILSSSSELIEFEDDEFEDDEFEDDEFEDEFVSFSDRRSEALASFNLTDCRQSNFTLSGRGGLPTSPDDLLSNSAPAIPWVNYSAESGTAEVLPPTAAVNLTEARGWTTDAAGNVFFEADAAATATPAFAFASGLCGGQNRPN